MEKTIKRLVSDGDLFTVVCWPESQQLMDQEGWEDNSLLINDESFLELYGSSAYMVSVEWINQLNP